MRHRYYICDVFTERLFGGNPLAVLPDAQGLSDEEMQRVAREFNFSESTFVFPPESGGTRRVRIFTPTLEVPFAGHPNVGTGFVLASTGELGPLGPSTSVVFEEKAGRVPLTVQARAGVPTHCELSAPEELFLGKIVPRELVARALSLKPDEVVTRTHSPQVASVGLPWLCIELADRSALERVRIDLAGLAAIGGEGVPHEPFVYVRSADEFDLRSRAFAPLDGVPEDPATGSANCALAGLLAHYDPRPDGEFSWRIAQGVEMGRPSRLDARAEKRDGRVVSTHIGGASVMFAEGWLELD